MPPDRNTSSGRLIHDLTNDDSSDSDNSFVEVTSRKKPSANVKKAKKKKKAKPKPKSKPAAAKKPIASPEKILRALEVVLKYFEGIGSEDHVQDWMDDNGFSERDDLQKLRKSCTAISNILQAKASPVEVSGETEASETMKILDEYYVFRAGSNSVMLLAPIEAFRCNQRYSRKKVLGLIRKSGHGGGYPLMFAFPGWKSCVEEHPRMLDSEIWSDRVLQFADLHGHTFRTDGFDVHHQKKVGASFASHVEGKLMLFFACELLQRRVHEKLDLRRLWRLRDLTSGTEAKIFISEKACNDCLKFKRVVESVTGLNFTFQVCKNLGMLHPFRTPKGYKRYPLYAGEEEEEDEEDQEDEEDFQPPVKLLPASTSKVMVVIRSSPGNPSKTTAQVQLTQSRSSNSGPRQPRHKRQYEDSDDNEDYEESSRVQNETPSKSRRTTRAGARTGTGLLSPGLSPGSRSDSSSQVGGMGTVRAEDETSYRSIKYGGKRGKRS
jgi:hypothetical protein